jgi:hypothetical protein
MVVEQAGIERYTKGRSRSQKHVLARPRGAISTPVPSREVHQERAAGRASGGDAVS